MLLGFLLDDIETDFFVLVSKPIPRRENSSLAVCVKTDKGPIARMVSFWAEKVVCHKKAHLF